MPWAGGLGADVLSRHVSAETLGPAAFFLLGRMHREHGTERGRRSFFACMSSKCIEPVGPCAILLAPAISTAFRTASHLIKMKKKKKTSS